MKYFFLNLLLGFLCIPTFSQYSFSPIPRVYDRGTNKFEPEDLARFKRTTTVFVYRKEQEKDTAQFRQLLRENWTVTPFLLVPYANFNQYSGQLQYSYFSLGGFVKYSSNSGTITRLYYVLGMNVMGKKEVEDVFLARILLHPKPETVEKSERSSGEEMMKYLHADGQFYTGGMGFLKNFIAHTNRQLQKDQPYFFMYDVIINEQLANLKTGTLYIPDHVAGYFHSSSGKLEQRTKEEMNDLLEKYHGKYELISAEALNQKILTSKEPFYYLLYTRSASDKFVTVVNSLTGQPVYSVYYPLSYNIKDSDFKSLSKEVGFN